MGNLIEGYEVRLVEPGCAPGAGRWGALASFNQDISCVFPYLNAVLPGARYDSENQVLILDEQGRLYAFRPKEIRVANAADLAEAKRTLDKMVERVNAIWRERADIVPRITARKLVPVLDIFKLLPRTNCRQCGYLTCMAFAADLRKAAARLESCPPLAQAEYFANRKKLSGLIWDDQQN